VPSSDVSDTICSIIRNKMSRGRFSEYKSSFRRQSPICRERLNRVVPALLFVPRNDVDSEMTSILADGGASDVPEIRFYGQFESDHL
jgi:hypothetical protein